jgi:hypothetical protein
MGTVENPVRRRPEAEFFSLQADLLSLHLWSSAERFNHRSARKLSQMDTFLGPPSALLSIPSSCSPNLDWMTIEDPALPTDAVVPPFLEPETSLLVRRQPGTAAGTEDPFTRQAGRLPTLILAAPETMKNTADAATARLLEGANRVAARSKLELRRALKDDLSLHKGAYTIKERGMMRSRREAAVSRHNKIAYTRQLETLVQSLVHEYFTLAARNESGDGAESTDVT